MGRGDQVGGVRRSLGVSESLLRQSLLEIDTATFARMVSRGLLHGKTFLSRPLTVRIYFKFSVTQFDNVLCILRLTQSVNLRQRRDVAVARLGRAGQIKDGQIISFTGTCTYPAEGAPVPAHLGAMAVPCLGENYGVAM